MKTSSDYLQEGIAAYKQGQKQQAGRSIKQAIQLDPKNESAWLWLSGLVETDEQRRTCLKRVLALNPDNKFARRGLQKLSAVPAIEKRPSTPIQPPPTPEPIEETIQPREPIKETPYNPEPFEEVPYTPAPTIETAPPSAEEKERRRLSRLILFGIFLLFLAAVAGLVATYAGVPLPQFGRVAAASISPQEENAIISAIYENIAANNAENIDRYMATIHSQSRSFNDTRQKIETLYQNYDLIATISGVEIIQYSTAEARVAFTLETRKQTGPEFRDNRINGAFILRPEDGQWKLFDQTVTKIQYFEYVE